MPATAAQPNVADIIAPAQDPTAATEGPAEEPHEAAALKPYEPVAAKEEEPEQQAEKDVQAVGALYTAGDAQPDAELQPTQAVEEEQREVEKQQTAVVVVKETTDATAAAATAAHEEATSMEPEPTEALVHHCSVAIPEAAEETSALAPSAIEQLQTTVLDQVAEKIADGVIAEAIESAEAIDVHEIVAQESISDADVERIVLNEVAQAIAEESIVHALESFEVSAAELVSSTEDVAEVAEAQETFAVANEEPESAIEAQSAVDEADAQAEESEAVESVAEVAIAIEEQHEVAVAAAVEVAEEELALVDAVTAIEDQESPETTVPSEQAPAEDPPVEQDPTEQKIEESPQESLEVAEESVTEPFEIQMTTESSSAAESHVKAAVVSSSAVTSTEVAMVMEQEKIAAVTVEASSPVSEPKIQETAVTTHVEHHDSTASVEESKAVEESVTAEAEEIETETEDAVAEKTTEGALPEEPENTSVQSNDTEISAEPIVTEVVSTEAEVQQFEVVQKSAVDIVVDATSSKLEEPVEVKREVQVQEPVEAGEEKSAMVAHDATESQASDNGSPSKQANEAKSPPATPSGRTFKKAANGVRSLVSRFEVGKAEQSPDKLKYRTVDSFFSHDEERSIRVREERQKLEEAQSPDKPKFRTVDSFFAHDEERSIRVREEKLKLEALAEQKRLEALAATERALREEQARIAEQEEAEDNQTPEEATPVEAKNEAFSTEKAAPEDEIPGEAADDENDEVEDNQLHIDTESNQQEEEETDASDDNKPSTSPSMGDVASRLRKVKSIVRRFESPRRQESLSTLQIRTVRDYFPSASKRNIHVDDEKRRFELMAEQQRLDALAAAAEAANHGEYTRFTSPRKDMGPGSPKSEPHTPQKVFSTPTKKPAMPMINDDDKESSSSGEEEDNTEVQQETAAASSDKVKSLASRFESPHKDESLDKLAFRTVRTFFSEGESPSIRVGAEKEKFNALVKQRAMEAEQRLLASPAKLRLDAQVNGVTTESADTQGEPSEAAAVETEEAKQSVAIVSEGEAQSTEVISTDSVDSAEKAHVQSEETAASTVVVIDQQVVEGELATTATTTTTTKTTTTMTIEEDVAINSSAEESAKSEDNSSSVNVAPRSVTSVSTTTTTQGTVSTSGATGKEVTQPQPVLASKHLHKYSVQEIAPEPPVDGPLSPVFKKAALHDDVIKHSQSLRTIELTFLMKLMKRGNPRKLSHSKTWNGVFRSPVQQTP